ncbi:HpcH/HpaI aldolase family protein [Pelagibius sp.]|uniref:HpcH/HpaI aldolase family protein n=1 Tax=Pelagibius sp. TaxID=1931238 RepID=UPI003B5008D0
MSALKKRMASKTPTYGAWLQFASANVAEALVNAGFSLALIDNEHAGADLETTLAMMRAIEAGGGEVIIRVPSGDPIYLKRIMELGPSGLLIPQINTAEEAEAAVAACRYPPHGRRGFARTVRASRYGQRAGYSDWAHETLTIMVQIETREAMGNLEAIAAIEGIDMLFIGPYDLSGAVGRLGETDGPEVLAAIAKIEAAAKARGLALGSVPRADAGVQALFDQGYSLVMGVSDVGALLSGLQAEAAKIPEAVRLIGS